MTTPLSSQPPPSGKDELMFPAVPPGVQEQYGFTLQDQPLVYMLGTDYRRRTEGYQQAPDHHIFSIRSNQSPEESVDTGSMKKYEELIETLSPRLQGLLQKESEKPFAERRADVVAFDQVLKLAASGLLFLEQISQVQTDEWENSLPEEACNGSLSLAETICGRIQKHLSHVGHNDPHFDAVSDAGREILAILRELKQ